MDSLDIDCRHAEHDWCEICMNVGLNGLSSIEGFSQANDAVGRFGLQPEQVWEFQRAVCGQGCDSHRIDFVQTTSSTSSGRHRVISLHYALGQILTQQSSTNPWHPISFRPYRDTLYGPDSTVRSIYNRAI